MYSLNARDHFNCSPPPFLMTSTTKQTQPNRKGQLDRTEMSMFRCMCGFKQKERKRNVKIKKLLWMEQVHSSIIC